MNRACTKNNILQIFNHCVPKRLTSLNILSSSLPHTSETNILPQKRKLLFKTRHITEVYDFSQSEIRSLKKVITNKQNLEEHSITDRLKHLKGLGFSKEEVWQNVEILNLSRREIDSRVDYFIESGANFDKRIIKWFYILAAKPISALKAAGIFPETCDVSQTILSGADLKLENQNITSNEFSSLREVHLNCVHFYMDWVFGMPIPHSEKVKIKKFIPIKYISNIISLLIEEANIPSKSVLAHLEVLNSNPHNLEKMLCYKEYPLKLDIRSVLQENLFVATYDFQNVLKVLQVFEQFKISRHDVIQHSKLLSENPAFVFDKLSVFYKLDELSIANPLDAIHIPNFHKKVQLFLDDQLKRTELTILVSNTQRKVTKHIPKLLETELGIDMKSAKVALEKHPNWALTTIATVIENIHFLRNNGYSNEEIKSCLTLLLYSRSTVSNTLKWFLENEKAIADNPVHRDKHLHLCQYYIEKQNQFTWNVNCEEESHIPQDETNGTGLKGESHLKNENEDDVCKVPVSHRS